MDKKKGILLVALGTPRSCEADDVRDYLKEFLGDPLDFVHPFNDSLDFTRVLSEVVEQNRL